MHDKKILIPGNPPEDNPWVEHIHQPIDKPDARQYNIASNNSKLSMPEKTTGIIQAQRKLSSLRCFCNDLNLIKTDEQKATKTLWPLVVKPHEILGGQSRSLY